MKSKAIAVALLVLITSLFSNAHSLKPNDKGDEKNIGKEIQELIEPLAKSNNYSGSVLVEKNGKTIFKNTYGMLNREKGIENTARSKFFLASVSAMFTAAAVMKLVDDGKLSLDDKLSKFFPEFKNGEKMTIHILLTERSGIPRIGSQGKVNYSKLTESPQTLDQLIGYFKDYPLEFEPGTNYRHTRSSYILLARIIEKVSGRSFGEYLREEIFLPLGMKNSGHFDYKEKYDDVPNLAMGYQQSGVTDLEIAQQLHWSSKTGHASIYSSAGDLGKFAHAALNKELLSADSWDKMTNSHDGEDVGYGFFTSPQGKRKRFYMSGGSPGFATFFAVYPDDKLVVVMLSNIKIHVPYFTVPKIASIVFGEPYQRLNLVTPPEVGKTLADRYVGNFKFGADFYRRNGTVRITTKENMLFADGGPLIPIDEGTRYYRKFIHRRFWSTLEFVPNESGKIVALRFDRFTGQKTKD